MSARSERVAVQAAIDKVMAAGGVSGIALVVAHGTGPVERWIVGDDAEGQPLTANTLYAVASITKLATALAVLRLVARHELALDDPLAHHLPEAAAAQDGVSLRMLLSHTSGLPLDFPRDLAPPYVEGLDWPALGQTCLQLPLEAPPLTRVQYSNPGYGLLALVVERLSGQPFAAALASLVLEPLDVEAYLGAEPPRRPAMLADVRGRHVGTPLEPFNSPFWRSLGLPWGGLVTTLDGALGLLLAFRGHTPGFLPADLLAGALRNQAGDLGGGQEPPLIWPRCPWGLGPELRGAKQPHWAPAEAASDSFGHAGASGCLAWADPQADVAWVTIGTRTATGGWLIRQGPSLGSVLLARGASGGS